MDNELFYYDEKSDTKLILGDTFSYLEFVQPASFDMIFADPPYFLSGGGISNSGGKVVSVNKGKWDEAISFCEKHFFI